MRLNSITLRNYKKFTEEKNIDFSSNINLIIGNNGSGKSSILQAIAAVIGNATQELEKPSKLNWSGFNYELLQSGGLPPMLKMQVEFSEKEITKTQQYFDEIQQQGRNIHTRPGNQKSIYIDLDFDKDKVVCRKQNDFFQFRGYIYAKQLVASNPYKSLFADVGNIYWYTEERNSRSFRNVKSTENLEDIRDFLVSRYRFHQRVKYGEIELENDQRDIYQDIVDLYQTIFPDRKLVGSAPRRNPLDAYKPDFFYFSDGTHQYEISEMSAGERSIFPMIIDFANWKINNSIILIDEIELHLHPPLQQALISALPKLGKNNQFIITTHSDYVAYMVDDTNKIYL